MNRTAKTIVSDFYKLAILELVEARTARSWSQADLAKKWNRNQSVIAKIETCERRLDLIEFIDLCVILKIDPHVTVARIHSLMQERHAGEGTSS